MTMTMEPEIDTALPSWVCEPAVHYIAHTECGVSIRELARTAGCHASTVLRQVRRLESLRDDPLVDEALCRLGRRLDRRGTATRKDCLVMTAAASTDQDEPVSAATLRREGLTILRDLAFPGTVLAVAADMERAVVVRDRVDGTPDRLRVVDRDIAQAMALKDWISCELPGRVSRYRITRTGR